MEGGAPATQANSMDNRKKRIRSAWTRSVVSSRVIDLLISSPRNPWGIAGAHNSQFLLITNTRSTSAYIWLCNLKYLISLWLFTILIVVVVCLAVDFPIHFTHFSHPHMFPPCTPFFNLIAIPRACARLKAALTTWFDLFDPPFVQDGQASETCEGIIWKF